MSLEPLIRSSNHATSLTRWSRYTDKDKDEDKDKDKRPVSLVVLVVGVVIMLPAPRVGVDTSSTSISTVITREKKNTLLDVKIKTFWYSFIHLIIYEESSSITGVWVKSLRNYQKEREEWSHAMPPPPLPKHSIRQVPEWYLIFHF